MRKLKDKKVTIYREEDISATPGSKPIIGYTPIHPGTLWAYVRQLSAKEYFARSTELQTEDIIFTVNYRPDITAKNSISYKGAFYNITRVDTFEGYKDDLHLYATIRQNQPKPEEIFKYRKRKPRPKQSEA